jgi:hypothetical protein
MIHRRPYNPATQGPQVSQLRTGVHDRRARDINRGSAGHVIETEVEDPYDSGARIATLRSVRDDPLADHLARGHIDQAQYLAGREFQRHWGLAEKGPRAIQLSEAVDGNPPREILSGEALMAGKWLRKCYQQLGADGYHLICEMLIESKTSTRIALDRGLIGTDWPRFFAKRLWQCLDALSVVFGFSNGPKRG